MAGQSKVGKIGSRYARAFFEVLKDEGKAKSVASELESFGSAMDISSELRLLCNSSVFNEEKRRAVVEDLAKHLKVSDMAKKMLLVLLESKRLSNVSEVAYSLKLLALEKAGVQAIEVQAANDLSSDERKATQEKFKKVLGAPVEATFEKVPLLVGGVRVTAGGKTYDGTLATRLAALKEQMLGGY